MPRYRKGQRVNYRPEGGQDDDTPVTAVVITRVLAADDPGEGGGGGRGLHASGSSDNQRYEVSRFIHPSRLASNINNVVYRHRTPILATQW